MPVNWNQVSRIALLFVAWSVAVTGRPVSAGGDAGAGTRRAALAARCDELVRSAVRSPYGWGWTPEVAAAQGSAADAREGDDDNEGKPGSSASPGGGGK